MNGRHRPCNALIGLIALAATLTVLNGCGDPSFQAGDCVTTRSSLGGADIEAATCPQENAGFSRSVYVIDAVNDIDGTCPEVSSVGVGIQLRHEPDDVLYCLSLAMPGPVPNPATSKTPARESGEASSGDAKDFDPQGDGEEHPDEVPLAVDGDLTTSWTTETYDRPTFGIAKKSGVGLILDAGDQVSATELVLTATPGWKFSAYGFAGTEPPIDIEGWGVPLALDAQVTDREQTVDLAADGAYRFYLIWITGLPSTGQGQYAAEIAEAEVVEG